MKPIIYKISLLVLGLSCALPIKLSAHEKADSYADRFTRCIEGGYNHEAQTLDSDSLNKARDLITEAVNLYPDRIDLRSAKITTLLAIEDLEATQKEVLEFIDHARALDFAWFGYNDATYNREEGKAMTISNFNIFAHCYRNFPPGDGEAYLQTISSKFLDLVPDCVEALNYMAMSYMDSRPDIALDYLYKAQKLMPDDIVVISNIATTYYLVRNIEKMEYWTDILESMPDVPDNLITMTRYFKAQPEVYISKEDCKVVSIKPNSDGTYRAVVIFSIKNPGDVPAFLRADVQIYDGDRCIASASPASMAIPNDGEMNQSKTLSISSELKNFTVSIDLKSADGSIIESYTFTYAKDNQVAQK